MTLNVFLLRINKGKSLRFLGLLRLRSDQISLQLLKGPLQGPWSQTPLSCSRQSRRRGKSQNLQLRLPLVGYWGELVLQDCSPGMSLGRSGAWSLEKNGGIQTSRGLYPAIFPSV